MRVSVVVPAYRRPQSLERCLEALLSQKRPADEILAVVRAEDAQVRAVVRERAARVRLVTVHEAGVVAAMNAGLDAAAGEIVALTDDDAEPRSDWIARLLAAYEADPDLAAVGGRDWVHTREGVLDGARQRVGILDSFGRITGNHHLGAGPAREVDLLKGADMSVRRDLLAALRFDDRLVGVGTEHHWELALCLGLRGAGWRLSYDPLIAVDHHPQPRISDSRAFDARELRDAAHNQTLAVLEYLPPSRRPVHLAWCALVGTGSCRGLAQMLLGLRRRGRASLSLYLGAQRGMLGAALEFARGSRAPGAARLPRAPRPLR